ncbi:arylamine N-acetyltransferase 1 [Aspergillus falconensis]
MAGSRVSLSAEQVDQYFARIQLPRRYHRDQLPALDINFLSELQACHITTIPYENLSLHYAQRVTVSLDASTIHHKLVQRRRGGYCMENNILFNQVLLFLGFQAYLTGARLFRDGKGKLCGWSGWEHSVNIVTFPDRTRYLVDVGYGGNGPIMPLPFLEGLVHQNIGTQTMRLVRGTFPNSFQEQWVYQFRNTEDQAWTPGYAFTEVEFFLRDFEVMNFFTSHSPECFLTSNVLVVKFIREGDNVQGKIILDNDKVKMYLGSKSTIVQACKTESERLEVLENYFGIELRREERDGIRGRASSLAVFN